MERTKATNCKLLGLAPSCKQDENEERIDSKCGPLQVSWFTAIQEGLCSSVVAAASSSDNASAIASVRFASRTTRFVFAKMASTIARTVAMPATFVRKSEDRVTSARTSGLRLRLAILVRRRLSA